MVTTIQMHESSKKKLDALKDSKRQTYEEVIQNLIEMATEDNLEFTEETKKAIKQARKEMKTGKVLTTADIIKELGLK